MITPQQIRAVLADGGGVIDPEGRPVGSIVDVVRGARTDEPTWATLDFHQSPGVAVIVPLARARVRDGCVQVPYSAGDVCDAPRADATGGRLDPRQEEELLRYYAALDAAPVVPLRMSEHARTAVVPASRTAGAGPPGTARNGHQRLNGGSAALHPTNADLGPRSALPGLDVRSGDGSPPAYPAASTRPWPPLSTSSPGPPWWQRRQWRWPSTPTSIRTMRLELRPVLDLSGLPEDELDDLVLAAGEAASNAVEHARFPSLPVFDVLIEVGAGRARIVVQDHGRWCAPVVGGNRGRGLQMIGVLTDATVTSGPSGTTVVLRNRAGMSR